MSVRRVWGENRPQLLCGVIGSLFNSRARQTVRGLALLRRTYEYVLVMAALEGAREDPGLGLYYEGYVDALEIVSARALWVAKAL
jgi:hypothetical protein